MRAVCVVAENATTLVVHADFAVVVFARLGMLGEQLSIFASHFLYQQIS
jgi:hypothetical protein